MADDDLDCAEFASPPCYAHELDPLYRDQAPPDGGAWRDVARWRKAERERLYALRGSLGEAQRERELAAIRAALDALVAASGCRALSAYWPIRAEPDLRPWLRAIDAAGVVVALPLICAGERLLRFRRWRPGAAMRRGRWGIAEPAHGELVEPELVIAPLLGVDRRGYRLGNGGGYYDRTLASLDPRPRIAGVGYAHSRIDTIYPQAHDIPMDIVVTGPGLQGR